MEIKVGTLAGFCYGVKRAITEATEIAGNNEKIYCIGEIVHNPQVVKRLKEKGIIFVEEIEEVPDNSNVIFRAHGMPKETYIEAKKRNIKVFDLTCPNVEKLHKKVLEMKNDYFIILLGKVGHAENISTISFAGENSFILESQDDIIDCYKKYEKTSLGKVYILAQTTYNFKKFDKVIEELKENFCEAEIVVDNTICNATELRQNEVEKLSKEFPKMIIIGGKNSSNTAKLVEISKKFCKNVYSIETKEELDEKEFNSNDRVGIMAGASTPYESIKEVVEFLEKIGG